MREWNERTGEYDETIEWRPGSAEVVDAALAAELAERARVIASFDRPSPKRSYNVQLFKSGGSGRQVFMTTRASQEIKDVIAELSYGFGSSTARELGGYLIGPPGEPPLFAAAVPGGPLTTYSKSVIVLDPAIAKREAGERGWAVIAAFHTHPSADSAPIPSRGDLNAAVSWAERSERREFFELIGHASECGGFYGGMGTWRCWRVARDADGWFAEPAELVPVL